MKILHVIPSISPVRGGPSQAIIEMLDALNSHSAEIEAVIATTNEDGENALEIPLNQKTVHKGVPIYCFPRLFSKLSSLQEFTFSSQLTKWLWMNINHYDLLHIHGVFSYVSTASMMIARHRRVPYIVRPAGQLCKWSLQQSQYKKYPYFKLLEQANLNSAAALHFTSTQEQKETSVLNLMPNSFVLSHGLAMPENIPNASQRLRQQLNLPLDQPTILFLSRLHPKKGIELLIAALKQIKDLQLTCLIAGSGSLDYETKLKELVDNSGLTNRVLFTGFVQDEMKELLLQGVDLFALTSYSENFGVAVLEALARGVPVITTAGVALSHIIQQHHLGYVVPLNSEAIATQIQQALYQPEELKMMGDRAREFIRENYTWNQIAQQLIAVYSNVLSNSCLLS